MDLQPQAWAGGGVSFGHLSGSGPEKSDLDESAIDTMHHWGMLGILQGWGLLLEL